MSNEQLHIRIISPAKMLYEGDIHYATFPGGLGNFSVYPSHAPIVSSLKKGFIYFYVSATEKQTIEIESGFVEVKDNQITACVEEPQTSESLRGER